MLQNYVNIDVGLRKRSSVNLPVLMSLPCLSAAVSDMMTEVLQILLVTPLILWVQKREGKRGIVCS